MVENADLCSTSHQANNVDRNIECAHQIIIMPNHSQLYGMMRFILCSLCSLVTTQSFQNSPSGNWPFWSNALYGFDALWLCWFCGNRFEFHFDFITYYMFLACYKLFHPKINCKVKVNQKVHFVTFPLARKLKKSNTQCSNQK